MKKFNLSRNKKYDFDITINSDTYAGELVLPYVRAALRSPDTIAKGYVRQIEGLNKSAVISQISSSNPIVAASCGFTSGAK